MGIVVGRFDRCRFGRASCPGTGTRQDHRCCLPGWFAWDSKTCGVIGDRRYRSAHGGRIPVRGLDPLCVAVHRSRAALSMAWSNFRSERCRTRHFHFPQTLDRRNRRAFACPGREAFALVSLDVQASRVHGTRESRCNLCRFETSRACPVIARTLHAGYHWRNRALSGGTGRAA